MPGLLNIESRRIFLVWLLNFSGSVSRTLFVAARRSLLHCAVPSTALTPYLESISALSAATSPVGAGCLPSSEGEVEGGTGFGAGAVGVRTGGRQMLPPGYLEPPELPLVGYLTGPHPPLLIITILLPPHETTLIILTEPEGAERTPDEPVVGYLLTPQEPVTGYLRTPQDDLDERDPLLMAKALLIRLEKRLIEKLRKN